MKDEEVKFFDNEFNFASKIEVHTDGCFLAITKEYPLDLLRVGRGSKQIDKLLEKYSSKVIIK